MIAVDVKLFNGGVYTVTGDGWTGPDPDWVELLMAGYRPEYQGGRIPAVRAAYEAAEDFRGEVLGTREVPDPDEPGGPEGG